MENFQQVQLLYENGEPGGLCDKLLAHQKGLFHRAFSIFVFNEKSELLMQKRALSKYHSGGLWTNTCCGHQTKPDALPQAKERLWQEMGFMCELFPLYSFTYQAELDGGLTEYENDTVLIGRYCGTVSPNPEEAAAWEWVALPLLLTQIAENPEKYTVWFRTAINRVTEAVQGGILSI
jgi:isopentenyl-diphosphate delta-isomerase